MIRIFALLLLVSVSLHARSLRVKYKVDVPVKTIPWNSTAEFVEGQRGMGDTFPFIAFGESELTPKSFKNALASKITTARAAIDVVRLFVAGPLVRTEAKAKQMLDAGAALKKNLEHLTVKLSDHRPESYAPSAVAWSKDDPTSWRVSLVAFEMHNMLRLVHVTAKVTATGDLTIKRHAMVDGPMTQWQSAMIVAPSHDERRGAIENERGMRREATDARSIYAKALQPARALDTAWVFARLRLSGAEITQLWGKWDRITGREPGPALKAYDLPGGGAVVYNDVHVRPGVRWFAHVKQAPATEPGKPAPKVGPVLHVLAQR
jgi:hypothetical protein